MPKLPVFIDAAAPHRSARCLPAKLWPPAGRGVNALNRPCIVFLLGCFALAIGCQQESPQGSTRSQELPPITTKTPREAPKATVKLTVVVVDDSPLAAGMKLLRGEWAQRSGWQLELHEWTVEELLSAPELPADLIIYPSRYIGTLVDRDWLRPLRNSVLRNTDLASEDIFPLVRNAILRYGNQFYALSLGEPPLMLALPLNGAVPATWEAAKFRLATENTPLKHPRAAELLARGCAFAQHRSQTTDWFDVDSMQPRIASPPFIRALEQMLANETSVVKQPDQLPSLSWPTSAKPKSPPRDWSPPTAFVPLPSAGQVYNPLREIWEDNEVQKSLVCLGFAGRSVSVARSTRNSASAFKLLTWLISENIATQLSPRSAATIWFRKSQSAKADKWMVASDASGETADAVTRLLTSNHYYLLPRIPGIDEYLQILDDAVSAALSESLPADQTLGKVAQQWNILTDRYGRDRQRVAYRRHLGFDDSSD